MSRPVGIDLGTTISVVACVDEDGRATVLADEDGESFIPSVVLLDPREPLVGQGAKDQAASAADRVVSCVKRYMGDPHWRFAWQGHDYLPEEISAMILRKMKAIAEYRLGGPVTRAVITVPAYFLDGERTATERAAKLAGLEVLKILNEPTAAALSFGFLENDKDQTILVYDLGGGTFDVTVMRARGGASFEMLTTAGNHQLGGRDWDARLRDLVAEAFTREHGVDPRDDAACDADLMARAEKAKITLGSAAKTKLTCQHAGKTTTVEVTVDKFEEITRDLLLMTAAEVELATREAKLAPQQIDMVLLVGGSTKMPMVRKLLADKARRVESSRAPDQCVALGAAIEAARLAAAKTGGGGLYKGPVGKRLGGLRVQDRTPHGLGMIAVEKGQLKNTIIIPRASPVPCEMSREDYTTAKDKQDTLTVHLVQGEDPDPNACVPLASFDFSGIPPRPAGQTRIRVTYKYNDNTVVEVDALDVASGKKLTRAVRPLVDLGALLPRRKEGGGPPAKTEPKAVALLIDSSGSMGDQGMREAHAACGAFLDNTNFEFVQVGLVQFGRDSQASELHALSRDSNALRAAIATLKADGGTPMGEAIEIGGTMLARVPRKVERVLMLFTDGSPNDRERVRRAAQQARDAGIKIICVGVAGADMTLLNEIASSGKESFFAKSGEELSDTFGNIAQVISGKRLN